MVLFLIGIMTLPKAISEITMFTKFYTIKQRVKFFKEVIEQIQDGVILQLSKHNQQQK